MKYDIDLSFNFEENEYEPRVKNIQKALSDRGIDLGIGYATLFMPGCMQWLLGFEPQIETAALAVGSKDAYILAGPEIEAMAKPVMKAGQVRTLMEFQILPQKYAHVTYCSLPEVLKEIVENKSIRRIGILVRREFLPIYWLDMLKEALGNDVEFVDAQDILDDMKYIKSQSEIKAFKYSAKIATMAVDSMLKNLKPGMREIELAAIGNEVAMKAGALNFGMDTIVMSGPRINTIVGRATNKVIEEGEFVSVGICPRFEGYSATVARTVVAGKATSEQLEFLEHAYKAYQLAAEQLKVGNKSGNLEEAAASYFKSVGLYDYVCYSIVHGIGLTEVLDEKVPRGEDPFMASTTLMLDVGLFFHPKFYGLRIENPHILLPDGTVECAADYPITVFREPLVI